MNNDTEEAKFWNITRDADTATIDIHGELLDMRAWFAEYMPGNYYTPDDFKEAMESCKDAEKVTVNIQSPGGDLFMGISIYNALRALNGKVTTRVRGIAASAASIIFCAGDERIMESGSVLMVHGVSGYLRADGYYNDHQLDELIRALKDRKKAYAVMNDSICDIYHNTTGMGKDEARKLISDGSELYMTADDAVSRGFATATDGDSVKNALRLVACGNATHLYSGDRLLSRDFHAPENAEQLGFTRCVNKISDNTMNKEDKKPENMAEQQQTLDADAIRKAERARISSITAAAEKLGGRVSKELVNLAINGDETHAPMTAEAFALAAVNAMQPEKDTVNTVLAARAEELAAANGVQSGTESAAPAKKNDFGVSDNVQQMLNVYNKTHNPNK